MTNGLKKHFPMIRERKEVLEEIQTHAHLKEIFDVWNKEQQTEFLDFCTGVRGVKLLYDQFFKEIINPDTVPERLEKLLSLLLETKVRILKVLPHDSARITAENTLLILDIVVQLEDGSIANVEAQKIGYAFPGQRSACYSADLLLRQYKRVRGERGKKFSYRDIKKVYTIVFFEKSTKEFHNVDYLEDYTYVHRTRQKADTGLKIDLLQEYIFIALDILCIKLDNKGVEDNDELEAWMTFLCADKPEVILELVSKYPVFKPLYEEVYEMCRNLESVMEIFSKELLELDKNTVQYMIDEQQNTIDEQFKELIARQKEIFEQRKEIDAKNGKIVAQRKEIDAKDGKIVAQRKEIDAKNGEIVAQRKEIDAQQKKIEELQSQIKKLEAVSKL